MSDPKSDSEPRNLDNKKSGKSKKPTSEILIPKGSIETSEAVDEREANSESIPD
jgi:hypothetical protein